MHMLRHSTLDIICVLEIDSEQHKSEHLHQTRATNQRRRPLIAVRIASGITSNLESKRICHIFGHIR